ncbi:MAG: DUF3467 domain-containing protein [Tannerella sp.]|jgi:hypothetical protein|nr:DUF3467 domain-containing protein [Tannerella sp.]
MEKNNQKQNQIQVELTDEVAEGTYANLAIIAHSPSEFIIDFIRIVPGTQKAKVKSRIILTPDNAKRLLLALQDNIYRYEETVKNGGGGSSNPFGELIPPFGGITGEA